MLWLAVFGISEDIGYPLIFAIVVAETGLGIPLAPGEIATVTGGIAAARDNLSLELVIVVAAAGAIVGDNIGYVIGMKGGRRLLERKGLFYKQRQQVLSVADPFFDKHGPKAVFIGRWLPVLRVYASWLAGASKMRYPAFLFWNAAGGIAWAASMALIGYWAGSAGKAVIEDLGKLGIFFVLGLVIVVVIIYHRQQKKGVEWVKRHSQPDLPTISDKT